MSVLEAPLVVKFYVTLAGNCPVQKFLEEIPPEEFKYFDSAIKRCQSLPLSDLLKSGYLEKMSSLDLYELRISVKSKIYRILCVKKDSIIWLLHIFQKKSQKIKQKEIKTALERFKQLKLLGQY